ncbi:MAG: DUF177 domain-containing protein [Clostridia bacterium]|nr:DUF177 domain-containing protein [Clostridia bacterium]MDR3643908.1 DUF177 domain-containing protein [Clostridia bacterium]
MELDLKPVFSEEGRALRFDYSLDLSGFELASGQYPFRSPIAVAGGVSNSAGVVTLKASAEFDFYTECDRCCKDITEHYRVPVQNVLVHEMAGDGGEELLLVESDLLDLDALVTPCVILSLPSKHLCFSGCKGLCPRCGRDLNEGPCECVGEGDPRLAPLKDFMD